MALSRKNEIQRETREAFRRINNHDEEYQACSGSDRKKITKYFTKILNDLENWGRGKYANNRDDLQLFLDVFYDSYATELHPLCNTIYQFRPVLPPVRPNSGGRRTRRVLKHRRRRQHTNRNKRIR
jgi:hypothetical protein